MIRAGAERLLLMAWLRSPDALTVAGIAPAEFSAAHRPIAEALLDAHREHGMCCYLAARERIASAHVALLDALMRDARATIGTSLGNVPYLAFALRDEQRKAEVQAVGRDLASGAISEHEAKARVLQIAPTAEAPDSGGVEAMAAAFHLLDGTGEPAWATGYSAIDDVLGGWHAGDLVVLGARPAMGKTALAINLMQRAKCRSGIISGEQSTQQVAMRMIAIDGQVSLHRMRTRTLEPRDWDRMSAALARAKREGHECRIYDRPAPTLEEIAAVAHQWRVRDDVRVLFVDYLQKVKPTGKTDDFRLQMGAIAGGLKTLARQLDICVVALSQVKRDVDARPLGANGMGRVPQASDLAESSILEQEADQILTLCRPEVYDPATAPGRAIISVVKNRHGPVRPVTLSWRGEYLRFENYAHEYAA